MDSTSCLQLYDRVNGARIEGRLETVTQRQKEIQQLYKAIQASERNLVKALRDDLGWSEVDSLLELTTVLQALRGLFEAHDIKKSLAEEHLISTTKSTLARRVPLGNILILAEAGAPISQSIIPLCLAVAEGNAVLIILSHTVPKISAILLKIIDENTDRDAIIAIKPEGPSDVPKILTLFQNLVWHGIFIQSPSAKTEIESRPFRQCSSFIRLLYQPPSHSAVIVTRKADITKAASDVAVAKFSFYAGRSVTSPGLVLVDEFVLDEFLEHLQRFTRGLRVGHDLAIKAKKHALRSETRKALEHFLGRTGARAIQIFPDSSMETLLIGTSQCFRDKFQHLQTTGVAQTFGFSDPVLPIQSTTSMEDALKSINELIESSSTGSAYLFGDSSEVRYLSLFTNATSKYLNHIPINTCLSPFPASKISDLSLPFGQTHFIYPASAVLAHPSSTQLKQAIASGKGRIEGLKDLLDQKLDPPTQKSGFQVGFFPQGGLVGMSHVLMLLGLSLTGIVWGARTYLKS